MDWINFYESIKTTVMEKEKIKSLIEDEGLSLADVIDAVIELNGIIGVGLIALGDNLQRYCHEKIHKQI